MPNVNFIPPFYSTNRTKSVCIRHASNRSRTYGTKRGVPNRSRSSQIPFKGDIFYPATHFSTGTCISRPNVNLSALICSELCLRPLNVYFRKRRFDGTVPPDTNSIRKHLFFRCRPLKPVPLRNPFNCKSSGSCNLPRYLHNNCLLAISFYRPVRELP